MLSKKKIIFSEKIMAFHWLTLIGLSSISKRKSQKCRIFFSSTFTSNLCNAFTPYFTSPIGLKVFSRNVQWVKKFSEGSLKCFFFLHIFLLFWLHNRRIFMHRYMMMEADFGSWSSNVSTTPLRQWGFRQCLPFSWTTLRGKHCWHPIAVMGVVDSFRH